MLEETQCKPHATSKIPSMYIKFIVAVLYHCSTMNIALDNNVNKNKQNEIY